MAYSTPIGVDTPTHWFRLNETTGTTLANSGSNTYTTVLNKGTGMTLNQANTTGSAPGATAAALLDGTANAYASALSLFGQFPAAGMTVELWYKGTDTGILCRWGSGSSNYWGIEVVTGGFIKWTRASSTFTATTGVVNDGNWHHIVCTSTNSTGTYQIYVDKVKVLDSGGGQSVANFSSNADLYIGDNTTNAIAGLVDEFAIYDKVLTASRIQTHYNNSDLGTAVTIDETTGTTSAQAYDVEVPNAYADLATATVSATANEATVSAPASVDVSTATVSASVGLLPKRVVLSASRDATADGLNSPNPANAESFGQPIVVDFELPADFTDEGMAGATLSVSSTGGATVYPITAEWSDTDVTHSVGTETATLNYVSAGTRYRTADVTDLVQRDDFYGFRLESTSTLYMTENGTPPQLILDYIVVPDVTVDVATATVTVSAIEADFANNIEVVNDTATASVLANDVTVDVVVTPDAISDVLTATASVDAYDVTVESPVIIDVDSALVTVDTYDVSLESTEGADVDLETATFSITHIGLTDVNGEPIVPTEDEDKFFVNTKRLLSQNRPNLAYLGAGAWFRMNETSGTAAIDRTGRWTGGFYEGGTVIGLNGGPNGRKYVHFDGTGTFHQNDGYIGTDSELYDFHGTLQFAIRTTKRDTFVLRMDDIQRGVLSSRDTPSRDIYIKDGRINYRAWNQAQTGTKSIISEFTGFKDIADGEWHLITFASSQGQSANQKVEVYVDDELDIRRNSYGVSFPDWIGGRPGGGGTNFEDYYTLPQSEWFVGDISEVVYFDGQHLGQDDVLRQYDTIFGFDPVYADTAKVTAKADEAIAKGNAKRILTLNLATRVTQLDLGGPKPFNFSGLAYAGSAPNSAVQVGNYQVFQVSAWEPAPGKTYIDAVTDEMRLLDLDIDVNLDDFDIINVINYPQTGADLDLFDYYLNGAVPFGGLSGRQQLERLVGQVKQAVVEGKGLFLTDPSLAVALGMIDDVEFVPLMREPDDLAVDDGVSPAGRDLRAAKINPWGNNPNGAITDVWKPRGTPGVNPLVDYERLAEFYDDEHANNSQRVRALVSGLTDISGNILTDSIAFWGYRGDGEMHAEKYAERPNGLSIGDEFRLMGTPHSGRGGGWAGTYPTGAPVDGWSRYYGFPAAPVANVKAGTVVTSFTENIWEGDDQELNPYKDYAVTVVVEPGDTIGGQAIAGRIFMNFTESFAEMAPFLQHGIEDVIPSNDQIANPDYLETDESREWNWSMWRGSWSGNGNPSDTRSVVGMDSAGNVIISQQGSGDLSGITYTTRWPQRSVPLPTMHYRGLKWLGDSIDLTGNATVGVATATVEVKVDEATAESSRAAEVELATARTQVQANNLSDQTYADAEVLLFTAEVTVKAQPFSEVVEVGTATVTTQAHDDFESIFNDADLAILRLPASTAILYMEER